MKLRNPHLSAKLIFAKLISAKLSRLLIVTLLSSLLLTLLSGCQKAPEGPQKRTAVYFDYFDTVITILGYEDDEEKFNEVCSYIESEFARYDALYDNYNAISSENNLYRINKTAADGPVVVDKDIIELLKFGKEIYTTTGGLTNIAFGSVLRIWHDHRSDAEYDPAMATVPSMEELSAAAEHADINDLIIDEAASTVFFQDPDLKLDVGAIAKGYAIERIAADLIDMGVMNYAINAGGNVRTIGPRADNTDWVVAIQNPDLTAEKDYVETLGMTDHALTTSGSYQRFYYVGDVKYHHIIHPDTLFPVNTFVSVSIYNTDAGMGDALSTALFNMTLEEGIELIDSLEGTEALWVYEDGTILYSANWPNQELGELVSSK